MPPCPRAMDDAANAAEKTSRGRGGGGKKEKKASRSSSSWVTRSMGFFPSSSSSSSSAKHRAQPAPAEAKNSDKDKDKNSSSSKKKKRSISISRSMTCAGSICSTKESSVTTRGRDRARSASSRSLRAPDVDVVDAVYASAAAAISATSSFNSEATAATTTTTATSASSPLSSALSSPLSSVGSSFRVVQQFRKPKLSGCYECHAVFDPRSLAAAATAFPCDSCGEVFAKADSLELHRATRHAVSELGPEDTSRNVVEIIFQSSWRRKQSPAPVCKIERVLKVRCSDRTVKRFEQYREGIKEKAMSGGGGDDGKRNARCVADGNELLRFHCTTFACSCSLGLAGGTALCRAQCSLCGIIRDGFRVDGDGRIATMATSGRAHDTAEKVVSDGEKRAMLVCRVVAGRVKKGDDDTRRSFEDSDFDSVSSCSEGVYSDLDELFVFSPRAILPCFVVIYSGY